jgi:hypothetical protein
MFYLTDFCKSLIALGVGDWTKRGETDVRPPRKADGERKASHGKLLGRPEEGRSTFTGGL